MRKRSLLLVDADPRALALTEANLKHAGGTARDLLQLVDGQRTLGQILEAAEPDDLTSAQALAFLYSSRVICVGAPRPVPPPVTERLTERRSSTRNGTPPPEAASWFLDQRTPIALGREA